LDIVTQMHQSGTLGDLFDHIPLKANQLWRAYNGHIVDVFNYAAQYGVIPQIERRRDAGLHETAITLRKADIDVKGRGNTKKLAEVFILISRSNST
jgi:hypothetical protein